MSNNQSTMTEFTFAPGEQDITGERFSPNLVLFWLKTAIAVSSTRVQYRSPNTILGVIPLGEQSRTIPLRSISSVDTSTKFNIGNLISGLICLILGQNLLKSDGIFGDGNPLLGFLLLIFGIVNLLNIVTSSLNFANAAGGVNTITVSYLEKDKLEGFSQLVEKRVFADAEQLHHEETMKMQQQQYMAQTQQAFLQQQMLHNQEMAQQAGSTAPGTPSAPMPTMPPTAPVAPTTPTAGVPSVPPATPVPPIGQ